jgi:DNA mismatch endonuclease Vsr
VRRSGNSSRIERQITNLIRDFLLPEISPDESHSILGTPDLAYQDAKVAVFVDGCYWHGCPEHSNRDAAADLRQRDERITAALTVEGWLVQRVWEHEEQLAPFIISTVEAVRKRSGERDSWIGEHLAEHAPGEWCGTCESWPHSPVEGEDGWCTRCQVSAGDHDDSSFAFPARRLDQIAKAA